MDFFEGFIFGGAYILRGLLKEGNLYLEIDLAHNWTEICVGNFSICK